jgi:renalase
MSFDVAVVGAGMAGLVCAQQLRRSGDRVVVLEKSRGLGGRVATRRLAGTWADHGLRCLEVQGALSAQLIQTLVQQGIVHPWIDPETLALKNPAPDQTKVRYVATTGITAIAKFLSAGLEIWRGQRVQTLTPLPDRTWKLTLEAAGKADPIPADLIVPAVVLAIPAPQALALLEPFADRLPVERLAALRSVQFAPCITAIAAYPADYATKLSEIEWRFVQFPEGSDLAWVGLESSKHLGEGRSKLDDKSKLVIVVQSSAAFADRYLEQDDLNSVGQHLLSEAAIALLPWLADPEVLQVHRWRYAFVSQPWRELSFAPFTEISIAPPLAPLWCCGDWCGGDRLESALQSGSAAASQLVAVKAAALKEPLEAADPATSFAELLGAIQPEK